MEREVGPGLCWAGLPVIATVARLLCRELTLQNECLRVEDRILKEKLAGRFHITDEGPRPLIEAGVAIGRLLSTQGACVGRP